MSAGPGFAHIFSAIIAIIRTLCAVSLIGELATAIHALSLLAGIICIASIRACWRGWRRRRSMPAGNSQSESWIRNYDRAIITHTCGTAGQKLLQVMIKGIDFNHLTRRKPVAVGYLDTTRRVELDPGLLQ